MVEPVDRLGELCQHVMAEASLFSCQQYEHVHCFLYLRSRGGNWFGKHLVKH